MTEDDKKLVERINEACNGHPHAKIPWPHYLLHDCRARIEFLSAEVERVTKERDAMEESLRLTLESMSASREASEARVRALEEALRAIVAEDAEVNIVDVLSPQERKMVEVARAALEENRRG